MRLGEECPYITPCGGCSRKDAPCDAGKGRKRTTSGPPRIPAPPRPGEEKGMPEKMIASIQG